MVCLLSVCPSVTDHIFMPPTSKKLEGHIASGFRVLTRILKIGVKCCPPENVGVLPYFSIETFQKVGVRNEKLE